ncbi:MAG: hypothetical protein KUG67_02715, partial [Proteobacteria bacterium]|nr:hypothetical protein [Pseudomonadota bacterium]
INGSFPALSLVDIDWVEFNKPHSIVMAGGSIQYIDVAYSVISTPKSTTGFQIGAVAPSSVIQGMVAYNGTSSTSQMFAFNNAQNLNARGCYAVDANRSGFSVSGASATFNLFAFACNRGGSSNYAAFDLSGNSVATKYVDCEAQACRYSMRGDVVFGGVWINPKFGNKGNITTQHINMQNNVPLQLVMENLLLNTNITFINTQSNSGYIGNQVGVQSYGGTEGDNRFFTYFGKGVSTGAGLTDTTTRTVGSRSLRLEPNTFVNMKFSFKVVARAGKAVSVLGFGKKNATLQNSLVKVSLFLPGSTVADTIFTMPDDTDWNLWAVNAVYNGTEDRYATVDIDITSPGVSGGYFYLDDIFNGTNVVTALDLWDEGFPSPIMFEQLGDPAAVWGVATTGFATGTTGEKLNQVKTGVDNVPAFVFAK